MIQLNLLAEDNERTLVFYDFVITAISNIRDFKAEARNLISRCELVSLIRAAGRSCSQGGEHALQILRR